MNHACIDHVAQGNPCNSTKWRTGHILCLLLLIAAFANGGTILVRSAADIDQNDSEITLREALLIANGSRLPFDHPNPDIIDEAMDVSGEFGAGIPDTILVVNTINLITLQDYLPPLNDSTDSIDAASLTVINGSALPADSDKAAFVLDGSGHTISGLTLMNFPHNGIIIKGDGNTLQGTIIHGSGATGIYITGAVNNTISNCISRNNSDFGIWMSDAQNNTITNTFIYGNSGSGLVMSGATTFNNKVYQSAIGFNESLQAAGNQGYGLVLGDGANNNRFGDPADHNRFTFIGNNGLDGIRVRSAGTDNNLLHSIFIGTDQNGADHGNSGAGIMIIGGPKDNQFGIMDQAAIGIGHNAGNGVTILGEGADGNQFYRTFIGQHPITGAPMGNNGHGIEIAEGASGTILGGLVEGTQLEINHTGGANHGLFINGTSMTTPVSNTEIGVYHIGDALVGPGEISIKGDAIHITGNVDGMMLGATSHPNTTNGAAGYGIWISGPNVRNIQMAEVYVGTTRFAPIPNALGGLWIGNGAYNITSGDPNPQFPSYFSGNGGPGITIDASDAANLPRAITIQNSIIGLRDFDAPTPNTGAGILIKGPAANPAPTLQNVTIGRADLDLANVISSNMSNGILLQNVNGVTMFNNRIGSTIAGNAARPNTENGILIDKAADVTIGSSAPAFAPNTISANTGDGIHITGQSQNIIVAHNRIGTQTDETLRLPNERHGIFIDDASTNILIESNTIHFNKEHGIFVSGNGTQARLTKNSIHLNEKEGIKLDGTANTGIPAPTLKRLAKPGEELTVLEGTTIPNGTVEVFADPMDTDPGMWGQGQHYIMTVHANALGTFSIPLTFPDPGTITVTVTDAAHNTSEFSNIMSAEIIQTVFHDDFPLLIHKKPTIFRLYVDSGLSDAFVMADAEMTLAGGPPIAPQAPSQHLIMGINKYRASAWELNRKHSQDSFNFRVDDPPLGKQEVEFTLIHGGQDRARLRLDSNLVHFQQTNSLKVVIVPLVFFDGTNPVIQPDFSAIVEMIGYVAAVYPIVPKDFIRGTRINGIVIDTPPHENVHDEILWKTALKVMAVRDQITLSDGSHPDYASGIINANIGIIAAPNDPWNGYAYPNNKATVSIDRYKTTGIHTGLTLSHEIGHTAPFLLGDTYFGGDAGAGNPRRANESDFTGNWILEKDGAFTPTSAITLPTFPSPGPLWKNRNNNTHNIYDFMSNSDTARWVDRQTYKILFKGLGGNDAPTPAAPPLVRQTPIANALIVRGAISDDDTVDLLPVVRKAGPVPPADVPDLGGAAYTAELQDGAGNVLDAKNFALTFRVENFGEANSEYKTQSTVPFYVVLTDDPAGEKVIIRKNGVPIGELGQSNNAPTIELIGPHGPGGLTAGTVDVSWTASDADADPLIVNVFYSPDAGATLLPVAVDLEGLNAIEIPTDQLPTGPAPVFVVSASDGWDQAMDMSNPPLSVPDREPLVKITHPKPGTEIYEDVGLGLFGAALDAEDGILLDEALVWALDGFFLAEGMNPTVLIPAGPHILRLTATDSFGNEVFDEITINSSTPISSAGEIADYVLGRVIIEPPAADLDENGIVDIRDVIIAINIGR